MPPNTYVVLDIPSPYSELVLALRERQFDPLRYSLPAETSISGSSGTGPISIDEDSDYVVQILDRIAAETPPIRTSFGPIRRFPNSDVFYLSFVDERPFRELHQRIAGSGLRFQASAFPFGPHCTVRTRTPITDAEAQELMAARISGEFTLGTLSLYDLPERPSPQQFATLLCLLHRARLTGRS